LAGGVGNSKHLAEGLSDHRVDAVATANLLNFMGNGLALARAELIDANFDIPVFVK
jgi:cyclase